MLLSFQQAQKKKEKKKKKKHRSLKHETYFKKKEKIKDPLDVGYS